MPVHRKLGSLLRQARTLLVLDAPAGIVTWPGVILTMFEMPPVAASNAWKLTWSGDTITSPQN